MKYLTQAEATRVDDQFFSTMSYTLDQLMELAGYSVSVVVQREFPPHSHRRVLVVCGPGNNGGDGLVCARHLSYFGYEPEVVYPKPSSAAFLAALVRQLAVHRVPVSGALPADLAPYDVVVDAVFGYSFKPPVRGSFADVLKRINDSGKPVVSVDVPSGWDVEKGNTDGTSIANPAVVVSMSAVKLCMKEFKGIHYLGGRFVPPQMAREMGLDLPQFPGSDPVVRL
eukprot:m51a1_g11910 hypothetical protein (226) ;mRNA; f:634976-635969